MQDPRAWHGFCRLDNQPDNNTSSNCRRIAFQRSESAERAHTSCSSCSSSQLACWRSQCKHGEHPGSHVPTLCFSSPIPSQPSRWRHTGILWQRPPTSMHLQPRACCFNMLCLATHSAVRPGQPWLQGATPMVRCGKVCSSWVGSALGRPVSCARLAAHHFFKFRSVAVPVPSHRHPREPSHCCCLGLVWPGVPVNVSAWHAYMCVCVVCVSACLLRVRVSGQCLVTAP